MKQIKRNGSWTQVIKEQLNVKNTTKLAWMAQYAAKHDMFERRMMAPTMIGESLNPGMNTPTQAYGSNIQATPGNTMGMGNFGAPQMVYPNADGGLVMGAGSNVGGFNSLINQVGGSGDLIQQSTVPVALWVAANTPGLDLVGVVNANGPVQQFQFLDFPYAGGKFGRNNEIATLDGIGEGVMEKPSYVKVYLESVAKTVNSMRMVTETVVENIAPKVGQDQYSYPTKPVTKYLNFTVSPADATTGAQITINETTPLVNGDAVKSLVTEYNKLQPNGLTFADVVAEAKKAGYTGEDTKVVVVKNQNDSEVAIAPKDYILIKEGNDSNKPSIEIVPAVAISSFTYDASINSYKNASGQPEPLAAGVVLQYVKPTRQGDAVIAKTIQVTTIDGTKGTEGKNGVVNTSFGIATKNILGNLKDGKISKVFDLVATGDQRIAGYTSFSEREEDTVHGFGRAPMSRGENETGTGNIIGARTFQKWIEMDASEIQGTVTRQQVQDMKVYGIDVIGRILDQMANELTQEINTQILTKLWRLGRINHDNLKKYQGFDLDLDVNVSGTDGNGLTDYMRYGDKQRRIQSRMLAAINVISALGRYGRPNWIITNVTTATALQDSVQYEAAPVENELSQMADMYMIGTFAGLQVYVDPMMDITRNQVLVGRRTSGEIPGVIFMPYILAETVSIIAEGTMSNKMLMNSRYAVAEVGFAPESQYYAFEILGDII